MVSLHRSQPLPTSSELPCSDDTPVDNEDQNFLPNYLLFLLERLWGDRQDWFFGVDMAIYHTTGVSPKVPVVPDAFLSLGVPRRKPANRSRRSYVLWEEGGIVPLWVLEMVSWTPGGEYEEKLALYQTLGVQYYTIYNPEFWQRDRHQPLEIYQLIRGEYQLQLGEPFWMAEVGLALGRSRGVIGGIEREVLAWFDQGGDRYLSAAEEADQERRARLDAVQSLDQERRARLDAVQSLDQERRARLDAVQSLHQLGLSEIQIANTLGLTVAIVRGELAGD